MTLLPEAYRAVLTDRRTLVDNPLATRDARKESRRLTNTVLLAITLLMIAAGGCLTLVVIHLLMAGGYLHRLPPWMGRSYGVALFGVFSFIHIGFVSHAAFRSTNAFFLNEYRQNTLHALLGASPTPFHLVLQATIHPFKRAMFVAFAGLPFYLFAVRFGGVTLLDVVGLFLVFAMTAFGPPRWRVPALGGLQAEEIIKKKQRGRGTSAMDVGCTLFFVIVIFGWRIASLLGANWTIRFFQPLFSILPSNLTVMLPGVITWILIFERLLLTSLPFYAVSVPPILFALPLYAAAQLMSAWLTSMYLRIESDEQLATLWDMPAYSRSRTFFKFALGFVILGYLWKPYVGGGVTAFVVSLTGGGSDTALSGVVWLIAMAGAADLWPKLWSFRSIHRDRDPMSSEYLLNEIRLCSPTLIAALGLYLIACVAAGRNPFPPQAAAMMGKCLLLILTGSLLIRLVAVRGILLFALLLLPLAAWAVPGCESIAAVSPLSGLLSLTPHTKRIVAAIVVHPPAIPPWYLCAAIPASMGTILTLFVSVRTCRFTAAKGGASTYEAGERLPESRWQTAPLDLMQKKRLEKTDHPRALTVIRWIQDRWDNPVMIKELRVLLRGHLGRTDVIICAVILLMPIILLSYDPRIAMMILEEPARTLYGRELSASALPVACNIAILAMGSAVVGPLIALGMAGTAFGKERIRATLGFILASPVKTSGIVMGKLVGLLTPTIMVLAVVAAWNLLASLFIALLFNVSSAIIGFLLATAIPVILTVVGGFIGLACSTLLRKDQDAIALAMLVYFGYVAAVISLTVVAVGALQINLPEPSPSSLGFVALCIAILSVIMIAICLAIASFRIGRARRGDVTFESSIPG